MTEGESLLASIIADPDDDDVRLVYADWLEEYGGDAGAARAEFIRVQIALAPLKRGTPKKAALEAREKELVALHVEDWARPLPEWARPKKRSLVADESDWFGFRRGFVQGVIIPEVKVFLAEAPAVFASEPITHLYLGNANALTKLKRSREFLGITGLRFSPYALGDAGAVRFSKLPIMPRLRHLRMYKNEIGDRGLKALAKWPGLATVEELELGFNDFEALGIEALIESPHLTSLKRLDVSDSRAEPQMNKVLRERFGKMVEL